MIKLEKPKDKISYPKRFQSKEKSNSYKHGIELGKHRRKVYNFVLKASKLKNRDKIIDYWINKFYAPEWKKSMIAFYRSSLKKEAKKSIGKKSHYVNKKNNKLYILWDGDYIPWK